MGRHLHACACGKREFRFHSCNHRSCPPCSRQATAAWVGRELGKRAGAPYFMVTFTLPGELRPLFHTPAAKEIYQIIFAAASSALADTLANPRWLGAKTSGFTLVLHTWNQRLHFHPHLHAIAQASSHALLLPVLWRRDEIHRPPAAALACQPCATGERTTPRALMTARANPYPFRHFRPDRAGAGESCPRGGNLHHRRSFEPAKSLPQEPDPATPTSVMPQPASRSGHHAEFRRESRDPRQTQNA